MPGPQQPWDAIIEKIVRIVQDTPQQQGAHEAFEALYSDPSQPLHVRAYALWGMQALDDMDASHGPVTYHVAANDERASDENAGGRDDPFRTIQRAAMCARAGDTVVIHQGEYRECVRPFGGGRDYGAMITYQAAEDARPVIKAMDVWQPVWQKEDTGCWSAGYTPLSWDKPGGGPQERCEQVFVDGGLLQHVETKDAFRARPQTMWIDDDTSRIWIHLPEGRDPAHAVIERSVRAQCFTPAVRGLGYIRVRGLHMQGGAAHKWHGANWHEINHMSVLSVEGGHHWILEDNVMEWGNAQGLELAIGGFAEPMKKLPIVTIPLAQRELKIHRLEGVQLGGTIARRNTIRYNGIAGIVGIGGANELVIEDNCVYGNNRKHHHRTCEEAGIKIHSMRNGRISGNTIADNDCHGIWIDCRCAHNRISGNILKNNTSHAIFHEISDGPLLVDNNVIIDTSREHRTTGFYTHDGNNAVVTQNYIHGCLVGVRIRALFHRMQDDRHTTTNNNVIINNVFSGCREAAISLMPEVPRCEGNRSEGNIFWDHGRMPYNRVENSSDVGVKWERTETGAALGVRGGGNLPLSVFDWQRLWHMDRDGLILHPELVFDTLEPDGIRDTLRHIWTVRGFRLDGLIDIDTVAPVSAVEMAAYIHPDLYNGARMVRTFWYAPAAGLSVLHTPTHCYELQWNGNDITSTQIDRSPFAHEPAEAPVRMASMAPGDETRVWPGESWRLQFTQLEVDTSQQPWSVRAGQQIQPGTHALILTQQDAWCRVEVPVAKALTIDAVSAHRDERGTNSVRVSLTNHSLAPLEKGEVRVRMGDDDNAHPVSLGANSQKTVDVHVSCNTAAPAEVEARFGAVTATSRALLSFAVAYRDVQVEEAPRYEMDDFPGGLYPEGADAFVFYMERLHAGWRASCNQRGLVVQVEVDHTYHIASRRDMEGIHTGDGVKIGIKGSTGDKMAVIGMALLSETGEQTYGFCKSANEEKYPVGRFPSMDATIVRQGTRTTYRALITWDMINLAQAPAPGSRLPFSVFVSCRDPDYKYGLQWFYGIKYDAREGDEAHMGRLWIA
jgi:parallel beta-helix repeat protein